MAMIVILLVIIWTIIALLSVFDDILSKSPVLRASQLRVIFKYLILWCISVGGILILSVLLGSPFTF
jgi:miniconductance mechanosensitive channel